MPDCEAFPCLAIAMEAARTGGTATAILNGANETAVGLFLEERIGFMDIPALVERAMSVVPVVQAPQLEQIMAADRAAAMPCAARQVRGETQFYGILYHHCNLDVRRSHCPP